MAEFEDLVAAFERFQESGRRAEERLAGFDTMRDEIATLEAVAHSPDHSVRVVAGPGGAVRSIQVTERALEQGAQALSSALMATLQQAVAAAARKQAEVVQRYVGDDVDVLGRVMQTQAEMLGTTVEALKPEPRQPRGASDPDDEPGSVMRRDDW